MAKVIYGAIIRESEDGGFWAEVPDLPGCLGQGDTFIETVESISNGIETHTAALLEDGSMLPHATRLNPEDGEVVYVCANPETVTLREPTVSAAEAARRLHVSPARISQLIKAGKLKAQRSITGTLVTTASIDTYASTPRQPGRPKKAAMA